MLNGICHCTSCKKRSGSAFGWSVYFPNDKIVGKTGQLKEYAKEGLYNRFFCARCGTTLYWTSFGFMPDHTGIAGGCFIERSLPTPNFSNQDSDRCAWLDIPKDWMRVG